MTRPRMGRKAAIYPPLRQSIFTPQSILTAPYATRLSISKNILLHLGSKCRSLVAMCLFFTKYCKLYSTIEKF